MTSDPRITWMEADLKRTREQLYNLERRFSDFQFNLLIGANIAVWVIGTGVVIGLLLFFEN